MIRSRPTSSPLVAGDGALTFYLDTFARLEAAGVPCLLGGAYALLHHTGISRATKDCDLFVRPADCRRALDALARQGYRTELAFAHWLGKAHSGPFLIDIIFSSGNGLARVDDGWFDHAVAVDLNGVRVRLCPVEEMMWSKAFVQERERFDGADLMHLLRARAKTVDWHRLLARFGSHWRVLLSHLVMFGFIYPDERDRIPRWLLDDLLERFRSEGRSEPDARRICYGTLLSREQYLPDLLAFGYRDSRLAPEGPMTAAEIQAWTAGIRSDRS